MRLRHLPKWERKTAVSDYDWNDEALSNEEPQLVKNLRKEIAKRDAALKERDNEFSKLQDEVRRQSVSSILRDMGVKSKVANLIPKDIEADPAAIKAWVTDYEDVFGSSTIDTKPESAKPEEANDTSQEATGEANVDPAVQAAWNRMQTAENSAGQVPTGEDAQLAWLANAARQANDDPDKFFAFLRGDLNP